jgi:LmbE family N-acetylglucosaminyl deacetylase
MSSSDGQPAPDSHPPAPKVPTVYSEPPHRGRVLVISPHPDDESIGPGATLAMHARLGDLVSVIFITSGIHGDASGRYDPAEYTSLRQAEAREAAEVLGLSELEFWDYPDGCVVNDGDLATVADRLADAFSRFAPDVLYVPHPGETHSDHFYASVAAARARKSSGLTAPTLGYEVWSPLDVDVVIDVSDTYTVKLDAIRRYETQLESTDIIRAVDGLNRFRACLLPDKGLWAEVFQEL